MYGQKGIQKEYNGTERGIRGTLRSPGADLQHGAQDLVPAAFGKGGGLYAQDLQERREVNPHHPLRGSFPLWGKRPAAQRGH